MDPAVELSALPKTLAGGEADLRILSLTCTSNEPLKVDIQ